MTHAPATEFPRTPGQIAGDDHVADASESDAVDGAAGNWIVRPGSEQEVSDVLRATDESGVKIVARGSGTKLDWGNPPTRVDLILATDRLNRIIEHAAGDMTATVQAGCTVSAFLSALAERGQRLALDPLWPGRATIGGIIATNDSGALRSTYGTVRDHLIGVTVVLADGTIAKSGGKVVKNVAGYDLPKLFTGSFGTLGIITQATFRLYPLAHAADTLRFDITGFESLGRALSALSDCSLVASAAQFEAGPGEICKIDVLVEGLPGALPGKLQRIASALLSCDAKQNEPIPNAWTAAERLFDDKCVAKISLLPTQWPEILRLIHAEVTRKNARWKIVGLPIGVGLVAIHADDPAQLVELIQYLRSALAALDGSLTIHRCPIAVKRAIDVWPDVGSALPLMRRVKSQFDPNGTLSPGRFVGGI